MIPYLVGLTTFGSIRPYFRKHILNTLEPTDFLFVNSIFISFFVLMYFLYIYVFSRHTIKKTYDNCCKLSFTQLAAVATLAIFTVAGSLMYFSLEKYHNTPFINNLMLKAFSTIALFIVGVFFFEEIYHSGHFLGIALTTAGICVLLFNPIKTS